MNDQFQIIPTDYALAYSALAHRVMQARMFLMNNNTSGAQTVLNEAAHHIYIMENRIVVCNQTPTGVGGVTP